MFPVLKAGLFLVERRPSVILLFLVGFSITGLCLPSQLTGLDETLRSQLFFLRLNMSPFHSLFFPTISPGSTGQMLFFLSTSFRKEAFCLITSAFAFPPLFLIMALGIFSRYVSLMAFTLLASFFSGAGEVLFSCFYVLWRTRSG